MRALADGKEKSYRATLNERADGRKLKGLLHSIKIIADGKASRAQRALLAKLYSTSSSPDDFLSHAVLSEALLPHSREVKDAVDHVPVAALLNQARKTVDLSGFYSRPGWDAPAVVRPDLTQMHPDGADPRNSAQKLHAVQKAAEELSKGAAEAVAPGLRPDLEKFGGSADVVIKWGDNKSGLQKIGNRRGPDVVGKVLRTVALGTVERYSETKKTVLLSLGDGRAVLSLDEHGQKKTWLLTGWQEGKPDATSEVSAQSGATQNAPTFSRDDLGAGLEKIIAEKDELLQSSRRNAYFQRVFHGSPHRGIEEQGFKLNKIGTGEGAQVYGWGIYFAKLRDVAENYRIALAHREGQEATIRGRSLNSYYEPFGQGHA
ncbi:MAG: hypothetical protein ACRETM_02895 [Stenotrophobium sp.]